PGWPCRRRPGDDGTAEGRAPPANLLNPPRRTMPQSPGIFDGRLVATIPAMDRARLEGPASAGAWQSRHGIAVAQAASEWSPRDPARSGRALLGLPERRARIGLGIQREAALASLATCESSSQRAT